MESLAVKHRPADFTHLHGQRAVNIVLRQMIATGQIPTALLFAGSRGTGKTTTARIFAAALNCEEPPAAGGGPCGACVSCKAVAAGTSLDLVEVDAASNGLVDDIRALRQQVLYGVGGNWRVVVLDEAHSMSGAAFNALLKTLEEPPPRTVFILCTTEPGRITDTVASRCMPFAFHRIGVADMLARLRHICAAEGFTVEDDLLTLLAHRADGALRDAIMALDQATRVGITTVAGYTDLIGEADTGPTLLSALVTGDHARAFAACDDLLTRTGDAAALATALVTVCRDLLVLHAGGTLACGQAGAQRRAELAAALPAPTVLAVITVLWELKTRLHPGEDPRAGLDLAVALIVDKLASAAASAAAPAAPAPVARKLTLAELAVRR